MNVLAVLAAPGPDRKEEKETEKTPPPLTWWVAARTWKGEDLVDFLRHALPPDRGVPRVVVMENAGRRCGMPCRTCASGISTSTTCCPTVPS